MKMTGKSKIYAKDINLNKPFNEMWILFGKSGKLEEIKAKNPMGTQILLFNTCKFIQN